MTQRIRTRFAPSPTGFIHLGNIRSALYPWAFARANAFHVINSTQVVSIATNLGDTKSIITHPGTTSHGRLTEAQRQAAGIKQSLIRFAAGLEYIDDLKADLARGLDSLT